MSLSPGPCLHCSSGAGHVPGRAAMCPGARCSGAWAWCGAALLFIRICSAVSRGTVLAFPKRTWQRVPTKLHLNRQRQASWEPRVRVGDRAVPSPAWCHPAAPGQKSRTGRAMATGVQHSPAACVPSCVLLVEIWPWLLFLVRWQPWEHWSLTDWTWTGSAGSAHAGRIQHCPDPRRKALR